MISVPAIFLYPHPSLLAGRQFATIGLLLPSHDSQSKPMHDSPQVNSAIDAVRCLYLAKVAEQKGHSEAAQRWQQMANGWLSRLERTTGRREQSLVGAD